MKKDQLTDLQMRMIMHQQGQLTWPLLDGVAFCDSCDHYQPETKNKGRCRLVKSIHRVHGVRFIGSEAIECSKWKAIK